MLHKRATQEYKEADAPLASVETPIPETDSVETAISVQDRLRERKAVDWLETLQRETIVRRRWTAVAVALFNVILGLCHVVIRMAARSDRLITVLVVLVTALFLAYAATLVVGYRRLRWKEAENLARISDAGYVGPLLEIVYGNGIFNFPNRVRRQAKTALARLLPRVTPSDAPLFTEHRRQLLRSALNLRLTSSSSDVDLVAVALGALEQIGDWQSAPQVEMLAKTCRDAKVFPAARRCLPYLKQLAEAQKTGEDLLRASSAPTSVQPETLLRPAQGIGAASDSNQLLRAGQADGDSEVR